MAQRVPVGDYVNAIKDNAPVVLSGIKELAGAAIKPSAKHIGIGSGLIGATAVVGFAALRILIVALAFLASWLYSRLGLSVLFSLFLGFITIMVLALLLTAFLATRGIGQFKQVHGPSQAMKELSTTMSDVSTAASAGADIAKAGPPRHADGELTGPVSPMPKPHYVVDPIYAAKVRAEQRAAAKKVAD
jgi:hypothetical protein